MSERRSRKAIPIPQKPSPEQWVNQGRERKAKADKAVKRLTPGQYTFVVTDSSPTQNFRLSGPGVNKQTSVRGVGRATWQVRLRRGSYVFSSSARASLKRTFVVR